MKLGRVALMAGSAVLALIVVGGGLFARAGPGESAYRQVILFSEILSLVGENYVDPTEEGTLVLGAFEGMLAGLDARGAYLSPAEAAEWKKPAPARPPDPGISFVKAYGALVVVAVSEGSGAEKAGISPGDQIRRIGDRPVRDLSFDQASRLLGGEAGTSVRLGVLHPEGFRREEVSVTRGLRTGPPHALDVQQGTAILRVEDLARLSPPAVREALDGVRARGVVRLLIDLRNVVEGDSRVSVKLLDLFTTGEVLRLKDRRGVTRETVAGTGAGESWPGKIAVLVNGGSAGAAEAAAAVLREARGARLLGEPTYGLGAEARLYDLADGAGVLIPAYRWETAKGESWNGSGLKPDEVVRGSGRPAEADAEQLRRALDAFGAETDALPERKAA